MNVVPVTATLGSTYVVVAHAAVRFRVHQSDEEENLFTPYTDSLMALSHEALPSSTPGPPRKRAFFFDTQGARILRQDLITANTSYTSISATPMANKRSKTDDLLNFVEFIPDVTRVPPVVIELSFVYQAQATSVAQSIFATIDRLKAEKEDMIQNNDGRHHNDGDRVPSFPAFPDGDAEFSSSDLDEIPLGLLHPPIKSLTVTPPRTPTSSSGYLDPDLVKLPGVQHHTLRLRHRWSPATRAQVEKEKQREEERRARKEKALIIPASSRHDPVSGWLVVKGVSEEVCQIVKNNIPDRLRRRVSQNRKRLNARNIVGNVIFKSPRSSRFRKRY